MKNVIITGATDGIGKALIPCLYSDYNLILTGRSFEKMQAIKAEYPLVDTYLFDITDFEKLDEFATIIKDKYTNIDILINNAGANVKKASVLDLEVDDLQYMFNLNCVANFKLIKHFLPNMIERKEGHIINVLSTVCLYDNLNMAGYTASKKAMQAISKALTKEVKEFNIKVTSFYPGGVNTNFRAQARVDYLKPETVAKAIKNCIDIDDGNIQEIIIRPNIENNF